MFKLLKYLLMIAVSLISLKSSKTIGVSIKILKIVALVIFCINTVYSQKTGGVKIWVEKMTIPTYQTGPADKNPLFYTPAEYQGAQRHIYPYPYVGEIINQKVNKEYLGVFLENEYTKVCVTPEMGGRLYYAIDKTNNYNIVYYNKVVKPALIGMAGAWTSGGAEWNIPHHHRPTSFSPVDYRLINNADGSKTVWVGEYEKRNQTRWLVGLTLEPGKAYIKTEFRYFNVTPVQHSFLFWANTAVHANESYQVIFPPDVEKAVYHAKTQFTNWPIANQVYQGIDFTKGQDISWWKNTMQPTSFFAWDTKQDFIGGIDHGRNAGTIKVGDRFIFPGKKFWNWGPNNVGRAWDKKLTDEEGPYLELMMGAYSDNQPDYSFINPMSEKQGIMYYYGIKNMDNVKEANTDFAINLEQKDNKVIIQVNATAENKNINIQVSSRGETLFKEIATVSPAKPYSNTFSLPANTKYSDLKARVISAQGKELISWQPLPRKNLPHPETYKAPVNPREYKSAGDLFLAGLRIEQFGNANFDAEKYYAEALKLDPRNILVNTQLGITYLKRGMYEKAESFFRVAANKVTSNHTKPKLAESLYYLGVTLAKQEKYEEAREILNEAAWTYEWASPAYTLLCQIECLRTDFKRAVDNAGKALLANPLNIEALNLKTMILRHSAQYKESLNTSKEALMLDPLNFNTINELYLLSSNIQTGKSPGEWLTELKERLRNEADNYLETASRYGNAGFYEDALNLLSKASSSADTILSRNPMIYYYMGYYYNLKGDKTSALKYFQTASKLPLNYVFPYGETSIKVLKTATLLNANDANAHYFLGEAYADYQPDKSIGEWEKAISLNNKEAIYYRNLAFVQANYTDNINAAVENIIKAIDLNPNEARYVAEADNYMSYAKTSPEKVSSFIKSKVLSNPGNAHIQTINVRLKNFMGDYNESIAVLEKMQFRTEEAASFNIHTYWFDAHLLRGIEKMHLKAYDEAEKDFLRAMEFPANLESERDAKSGIALYFLAINSKFAGEQEKAKKYFTKMVDYTYEEGWGAGSYPEVNYYKGLACMELGKTTEAKQYFNKLVSDGNEALKPRSSGQYSRSLAEHAGRVKPALTQRIADNDFKANAIYSTALGYLGLGAKEKANKLLQEALTINPTHLGAKMHLQGKRVEKEVAKRGLN